MIRFSLSLCSLPAPCVAGVIDHLPPRGFDRGRCLGKLLILRMQTGRRRRWTAPKGGLPHRKRVLAVVCAHGAQHAAYGIRKIVMASAAVIDTVFTTAVRPALQQAQLAQQFRMIRQADEAAGEERRNFLIDLRLRDRAAGVSDAGRGPCAGHPLSTVIITAHAVAAKFLQQRGIGPGDLVRVKGANGASTEIDDMLIILLVGDAAGVAIVSNTTAGIDVGLIGNSRTWLDVVAIPTACRGQWRARSRRRPDRL
jgi:hypothetical protein